MWCRIRGSTFHTKFLNKYWLGYLCICVFSHPHLHNIKMTPVSAPHSRNISCVLSSMLLHFIRDLNKFLPKPTTFIMSYLWKSVIRSAHTADEHLWVSWQVVQGRQYFYYAHKWNYIYVCSMKPCDISGLKNVLTKGVYHVREYNICRLLY
jgi:hypothetical protein